MMPLAGINPDAAPPGVINAAALGAWPGSGRDVSEILRRAIDKLPDHASPWAGDPVLASRTAGMVTIWLPPGPHRFATTLELDPFKQFRVEAWGARIYTDDDEPWAIRRLASGGLACAMHLDGATFDRCGFEGMPGGRDTHLRACAFIGAPSGFQLTATQLSDWDLVEEGGVGSSVGGSLTDCVFYGGGRGVWVQQRQCTGWRVVGCRFAKNSDIDISIYSDNWTIRGGSVEQRQIDNLDRPHVQIAGREQAETIISELRFGPEGDPEAPSEDFAEANVPIWIGRMDEAETLGTPNLVIEKCKARGDALSEAFIKLNRRTHAMRVVGNNTQGFAEFIEFSHAGNDDGIGNRLVHNQFDSQAPFSETPSLGSWITDQ